MVEHIAEEICHSEDFWNCTGYKTRDSDSSKAYKDAVKELMEVLTWVLQLEDMMQHNQEAQQAQVVQTNPTHTSPRTETNPMSTSTRTDPHGCT